MKDALFPVVKKYALESFCLLAIFLMTWLGFGSYMAGLIVLAFIFSLFFREKRAMIFSDRVLLILLAMFVLNSVISSLLSIKKLESTLLSLLWFLVVFIPVSYARFSLNDENDFFIRWIVPASFFLSFVILVYLASLFIHTLVREGLVFKRYTFIFLGKATTPDTLTMLGGIGYGWLRQKRERKYLWFGLLYLLFCFFGVILTFDRGSVVAFFILMMILLSFDWKRLVILVALVVPLLFFSATFEPLRGLSHLYDFLYSEPSREVLSTSGQLSTFETAWEMIRDHWLTGVGTNNFSAFSKQYGNGRWYSYAHNFFLQFWAENGLFGMLFGLSIMGLIVYRWLKSIRYFKHRYIALGVGASFVGMLVGNLSNSTIWILKIALPFWLLAGAISAMYFTGPRNAIVRGGAGNRTFRGRSSGEVSYSPE